ncbi:response regulator [Vulgatibacter incomptus]|uniref:response regulator n=1 Tax=Vulgatibacter incomptus TaxID=1391653 RepID=UPI0014703E05|nr:response regulator [Vulgatibacter incomptus]
MPLDDGGRIAIVGAGPAGCIFASALLDGAQARHRAVSVSLYGATPLPRDDRQLVVDTPALLRLGELGLPSLKVDGPRFKELRFLSGRASLQQPSGLFTLARTDLVNGLRAAAMARGVRTVGRRVEGLARAADGRWVVRAGGASERADLVVLACGAGAPFARQVHGHLAPPVWRSCVAELDVDEALAERMGDRALWLEGEGGRPDLWLLPAARAARVIALGPDVAASDVALALLASAASGRLPGRVSLRRVSRLFVPAGGARPALPAVGSALGGAPGRTELARAAEFARTLAAAFLDLGSGSLLERSRREARDLARAAEDRARLRRSFSRFGSRASERALEAEARRREGAPIRPLGRCLIAAAGPATASREPSPVDRLRAFLALLWACMALVWASLFRRERSRKAQPTRLVYVVDDDREQAELLASWLATRGIPCRTFVDGLGAAAEAARENPAAIVLDVALPWIDGAAVCRMIKRRVDVPVLLATALPPALAGGSLEEARADELLTKPLDLEALAARLSRFLPEAPGAPGHRRHIG